MPGIFERMTTFWKPSPGGTDPCGLTVEMIWHGGSVEGQPIVANTQALAGGSAPSLDPLVMNATPSSFSEGVTAVIPVIFGRNATWGAIDFVVTATDGLLDSSFDATYTELGATYTLNFDRSAATLTLRFNTVIAPGTYTVQVDAISQELGCTANSTITICVSGGYGYGGYGCGTALGGDALLSK